MKCQRCGSDNLDDARFCWDCGAELKYKCPSCGKEVILDKRFCPFCGTKLMKDDEKIIAGESAQAINPEPILSANVGKGQKSSDDIKTTQDKEGIENVKEDDDEEETFEIPEKVSFSTVIDGIGFRFAAWKSYISLPISIVAALLVPIIKILVFDERGCSIDGDSFFLDFFTYVYLLYDFFYLVPLISAVIGLKSFKGKAYSALIGFYWMTISINLILLLGSIAPESSKIIQLWGNSIISNIATIIVCILEMVYFKKRGEYYNSVDAVVPLLGRNF